MADRTRLNLYTIPIHRAFADALADGLIRRFGGDPMTMARGLVLLPSNRAKRAITDAFVRASGEGLLLPRLVAIGDSELDEAAGALFDPADVEEPLPPAVEPLTRRLILARLIEEERARAGAAVDAVEAMRLAGELGRTLDQLLVEDRTAADLTAMMLPEAMQVHWERALELFGAIERRWRGELARLGRIDLAERRNRLMARAARAWRDAPPAGFVCAAGITTSAPAVARLLRVVAGMERGMVVLPGLGVDMPDAQWDALGPHEPDPVTLRRAPAIETHPQYHLKLLLDRMGVGRGEFTLWRGGSEHDAAPQRSRAVATALAPARFTATWSDIPAEQRRLTGVRLLELPTAADEAQAIAIALRETLETPGRTAALVTPDRALARRVAAHCARWGIEIDDSAGEPLSLRPPGTLLSAIAEAVAQGFAPVPLLALLKHPLVRSGEGRLAWLEGVRALDLALRGPRPAVGLAGIDRHLADRSGRDAELRRVAADWWPQARGVLAPFAALAGGGAQPPAALVAGLREAAGALAGDAAWARADGRAAADLLDRLEAQAGEGPALVESAGLPGLLRLLMDEIAIRPPQGGHPRLAIYGLIEARLQTADRMILGGLNEGVWPALPAPDPWLAPRIRAEMGLPALERRIGLAAHDLAGALGAPEVILTRARRDATAPTIASRFWLRLEALAGRQVRHADDLAGWTAAIDDPGAHQPVSQPAPSPPVEKRPRRLSVTEVDRLKADPYAFYARRYLGLAPIDPVDADMTAAWRGTAVHKVLEDWARDEPDHPERLVARTRAMLAGADVHPMQRVLWLPRIVEAIGWVADELAADAAAGRRVLAVELDGRIAINGVTLTGKFDRIDRGTDGGLSIVDYKTGTPPTTKAARAGFSLQLGLLGLMVERGGFPGVEGVPEALEYWALNKRGGKFGYRATPLKGRNVEEMTAAQFIGRTTDIFVAAINDWLLGDAPFTAKLHPEYAPYADYDQLMRRDEWWGRE